MSEPMTTDQAADKHSCSQCLEGIDCGHDCVISRTCSILCEHCQSRVWFSGDGGTQSSAEFHCPYCDTVQTSEWLKRSIEREHEFQAWVKENVSE